VGIVADRVWQTSTNETAYNQFPLLTQAEMWAKVTIAHFAVCGQLDFSHE
jgi:hypothetical protein